MERIRLLAVFCALFQDHFWRASRVAPGALLPPESIIFFTNDKRSTLKFVSETESFFSFMYFEKVLDQDFVYQLNGIATLFCIVH